MSNEFLWLNADERNRILAQVQMNKEAIAHLNEACHTAIVRGIEGKMYLVIKTRKGLAVVEFLNTQLVQDSEWKNNVSCGLPAIEPLLFFINNIIEGAEQNWTLEEKKYLAYMAEAAMEIDAMVDIFMLQTLFEGALKSLVQSGKKPKTQ